VLLTGIGAFLVVRVPRHILLSIEDVAALPGVALGERLKAHRLARPELGN
jgi:hypothetical protein